MTTTKDLIKELKKLQAKHGVVEIGLIDHESLAQGKIAPAGFYFLECFNTIGKNKHKTAGLLVCNLEQVQAVNAIVEANQKALTSDIAKIVDEKFEENKEIFSEIQISTDKKEIAGEIVKIVRPNIDLVDITGAVE